MRPTTLQALLVSPLFVYVAATSVRTLTDPSAWFFLGAVAAAAPVLLPVLPGREALLTGPALVLLGGVALGAAAGVPVDDPAWAGTTAGLLVGGPVGLVGVVWTTRTSLPGSLVATLLGLASMTVVHAVAESVAASGMVGPVPWSAGAVAVLRGQAGGIGAWSHGLGPSPLPLGEISDPIFVALALVLALGMLVGFLDPRLRAGESAVNERPADRTGEVAPAPRWLRVSGPSPKSPPPPSEPAEFPWPTAVVPLSVAVAAGFLWETAVSFFPREALSALAGGALGVVILLVVTSGVQRRGWRPRDST